MQNCALLQLQTLGEACRKVRRTLYLPLVHAVQEVFLTADCALPAVHCAQNAAFVDVLYLPVSHESHPEEDGSGRTCPAVQPLCRRRVRRPLPFVGASTASRS